MTTNEQLLENSGLYSLDVSIGNQRRFLTQFCTSTCLESSVKLIQQITMFLQNSQASQLRNLGYYFVELKWTMHLFVTMQISYPENS